jgi:hypothetical protein
MELEYFEFRKAKLSLGLPAFGRFPSFQISNVIVTLIPLKVHLVNLY